MTLAAISKILWVDNHIEGYKPFVKSLAEYGFEAEGAENDTEALSLALSGDYDAYLVDLRMGEGSSFNGIEIARKIHAINPVGKIAVLSSYLYLDRYREQLRELPFPVHLIEKDIPNTEADDFEERFVEPIRHFVRYGTTLTIDDVDARLTDRLEENPFDMRLATYMELTTLEKDRIVDLAGDLAFEVLQQEFAKGRIWVLLCGSSTEIRASASTPSEILPEETIMNFARAQDRAPLIFWAPVGVDDMWTDPRHHTGLKDYPTVTLQFEHDEVHVHFDTGAPWTFFSYEELLRLQQTRPLTNWGQAWRGTQPFRARELKLDVVLQGQDGADGRVVTITGQMVRNWGESPFARYCNENCQHGVETRRRMIPERRGLVGRNILTENELILVLDGVERATSIMRRNAVEQDVGSTMNQSDFK